MTLSLRTRFTVLQRDQFTCRYCGKHPPFVVLEIDHVHPLAHGGTDELENLVTSCWDCNRGKTDRQLMDTPVDESDEGESESLAFEEGVTVGENRANEKLRDIFLNRLDYGLETFADVVQALWPEPE